MVEYVTIHPANKTEKDVGLPVAEDLIGEDFWGREQLTVVGFRLYLPIGYVRRIHVLLEVNARPNSLLCLVETDRDFIFGVIDSVK